MLDPYLVLGVGRYDDDQTVKKAYRALSKQYHPDNNINNPNKAAAILVFVLLVLSYSDVDAVSSISVRTIVYVKSKSYVTFFGHTIISSYLKINTLIRCHKGNKRIQFYLNFT